MKKYIVIKPTRVRSTPTIWGSPLNILPIGNTFESNVSVDVYDKVVGISVYGKWIKIRDGEWTPSIYNNKKFMDESDIIQTNKKLGVIKSDYEIWGMSRPEHLDVINHTKTLKVRGLPQVHKLVFNERVELTKDLQLYWFGLLEKSSLGTMSNNNLKKAWRSLTAGDRAFTNRAGTDMFADFISKTNLNKPLPKKEAIICGGTLVEILGEEIKYGETCCKIRTLNSMNFDHNIDRKSNPELVFAATNSLRDVLPDGSRKVDPFWQLGGLDVPVPSFSNGQDYNWIQKYKVRELGEGEAIPSPYNPPR